MEKKRKSWVRGGGDLKLRFTQANQQVCLPAIQLTTKVLFQEPRNTTFLPATNLSTALPCFSNGKMNEYEFR